MKRLLLTALSRARLLAPAHRAYEHALAARARARRGPAVADGLPVPPPELIVRVTGSSDVEWFLRSGRLAADSVRSAAGRMGVELASVGAMLDFGCGCGRVTRHWGGLDGVDVCGSDRDRNAVEWCRDNLSFGEFATNGLAPPLAFPDERFGLVYALSVFTHLPEPLQHDWMRELRRVIKPGGHLVLTTHGAHYLSRLSRAERARFARGELVVRWREAAGTNLCAAYHPEEWVRARLATGFEVVDAVPEGAAGNPQQDLFVLRRM